ncbi:type II and III secretion system protein family protein [Thalassotalea euphylliae]|uniref:Type II and III secretion system protein family protein n=1 Tax=Thalassotalea euphylliae TaxID=1655234 RepID=A0A3E0TN03_9GAMM|nr:type II and III secretion system protein family protein [Thalassotalea euphylliae]REL25949.1 type II and III secretion system protein family protein [Thalassotalea euphylliae]
MSSNAMKLIANALALPIGLASALLSTASMALDLHVSEGQLIELPSKAKTVFIADDKVASYQVPSADKLFVFALSPGKTSLYALGNDGQVIYQDDIVVGYDTASLNQQITQLYPQASVEVVGNNQQLIVRGQVPSAMMAQDIIELTNSYLVSNGNEGAGIQTSNGDQQASSLVINQLTVTSPNQVNIRVRLAEVSRQVTTRLGLRPGSEFWGLTPAQGAVWSNGADDVASLNVNDFIQDITGIKLNTNSVMLDALATEGAAKLLAEPNLTAVSGETASFLAGGEYPVPISQTRNGDVIIEFKKFGVALEVTPTVLSDQRISLRLAPTVSSLDANNGFTFNNITIPGISTREAETTVELASGESFMLAGLLMNDESNSVRKFPFLGDLPVIGSLFRSTAFEQQETELVIIAEAFIVEPSQENHFNLPTDNYQPYSDLERLLNLSWSSASPTQQHKVLIEQDKPKLFGDSGFYY